MMRYSASILSPSIENRADEIQRIHCRTLKQGLSMLFIFLCLIQGQVGQVQVQILF